MKIQTRVKRIFIYKVFGSIFMAALLFHTPTTEATLFKGSFNKNRISPGSWQTLQIANRPTSRYYHTAVWTGTKMIIWGGYNGGYLNTGAVYDPGADTWTPTTTLGAPVGRMYHTAIWTGSEMIIWGGFNGSALQTGSRYDPTTDTWSATTIASAPSIRQDHTAIWTGTEMVIWGGKNGGTYVNTGARYNPTLNSWSSTATSVITARANHTAIWTGNKMVIWGGKDATSSNNSGAAYDPVGNFWTLLATLNAPSARNNHTAIIDGNKMYIWGGLQMPSVTYLNTGAIYDVVSDTWSPLPMQGAPTPRHSHTATLDANQRMVIWGGLESTGATQSAGSFNTLGNADLPWKSMPTLPPAPAGTYGHTAIWTGTKIIIFGGYDGTSAVNQSVSFSSP